MTKIIHVKAVDIARHMGIPLANFIASRGWLQHFMNRHALSIQCRTTLCQKLPNESKDELLKFQRFVNSLRREHSYDLPQIGNADQMPVWFDTPENSTVDFKGAKSISVRTTGAERQRCTVIHSITANGRKLPSYVVFKRKKALPNEKFPDGIIVHVHEKGWMCGELF